MKSGFRSSVCCCLHVRWSIPEYAFLLKAEEVLYHHDFSSFSSSSDGSNAHMFQSTKEEGSVHSVHLLYGVVFTKEHLS